VSVEIAICILSMGFSLFIFTFGLKLPPGPQKGIPGPSLFPMIVSCAIFILSLITVMISLLRRRPKGVTFKKIETKSILRLVFAIVLMGIYSSLWIAGIGNFIINSLLVFVPMGMVLSNKSWYSSGIYIIAVVIIIYLIFNVMLRVPL
jgi:hypothetical protein